MEILLRKIVQNIGIIDKRVILFGSIAMIFLLGYLDYLTGFELSFSIFYLLPVSITAWYLTRNSALFVSVLGAIIWSISNILAGEHYTHPAINYWNTMIRLGFFAIVTFLLTYLKQAIEKERYLSRTDFLTGVTNCRAFKDHATNEILRGKRYNHPITVAYIDLDNFKQVNDHFGHTAGDRLLRIVAETMSSNLRRTDIVARVGGDEFVILLPETKEDEAEKAIKKIRGSLLDTMEQGKWKVTFSIGVITFYAYPTNSDELLKQVDELMYAVKASGKNNVKFARAG